MFKEVGKWAELFWDGEACDEDECFFGEMGEFLLCFWGGEEVRKDQLGEVT